MKYEISNSSLSVLIEACGAEPQSIVADGVERLWCADPEVWGKHAPMLFPLIGRLRDGFYELGGQPVQAPKHGFCRERAFEVTVAEADRLVLRTCDDAETRAVYPFAFDFEVEFALQDNTLVKTHRITNRSAESMPFELGGHEAYALFDDDWRLELGGEDLQLDAYGMDESGALTLPKWPVPLQAGCLTQTPEQLGIDTVVLEEVPGHRAVLHQGAGHSVTVSWSEFPYLGVWTMAGVGAARYLCVEPWSALPDGTFMSRELSEKPGVISVPPHETVALTYRMAFQ